MSTTATRPTRVFHAARHMNTASAADSLPLATSFPVIIDVSAIPVLPQEPTPDAPFTHPKPKVMTGPRSYVRIVKARRQLVIVDSDLAELFGTTVDAVNRAVMRNACRFPRSLCFRMSNAEWHHLKHDAAGAKGLAEADRGNWLCAPLVFTDEGAESLSRIFDTFDATRGSVFVWRTIENLRNGDKHQHLDPQKVMAMRARGLSCERIGWALKCSTGTIYKLCREWEATASEERGMA